MEYLCLKEEYTPDPTWDTQLRLALQYLRSDKGKHVFEQLDMDRTKKLSLTRIACGFEILFDAFSTELRALCKQIIHYLASKDLWELAYSDVVTVFMLIGNIVEEGEGTREDSGAEKNEGEESKVTENLRQSLSSKKHKEEERILAVGGLIDASVEKNKEDIAQTDEDMAICKEEVVVEVENK